MLVIIDYKMGNVASVAKTFKAIYPDQVLVSNAAADIDQARFIVLPGVGAFGDGMSNLRQLGLVEILNDKVLKGKTPFLGICLGMQLLAEVGNEFGRHDGLGWIQGEVVKLQTANNLRLPHVGWNEIIVQKDDALLRDLLDNNFYFVNSYHLKVADSSLVTSTCDYGQPFVATIRKDNIFATQFHPEKSQTAGLKLLHNFLNLSGHA